MGQQTSDFYRVEEVHAATRYDRPLPAYIWMDARINGTQNKLYISRFKERFDVQGQDSFQALRVQVETWNPAGRKLRLICAASLKDEEYRFIQDNDKIQRAMLFCGNKTRASNLMRDFPKIKKACFNYNEVIKVVKVWENQYLTSLLFFQPQQVQPINKLHANIKALTEPTTSNQQAREDYRKYFSKLPKEELDSFNRMNEEYSKLKSSLQKKQGSRDAVVSFFKEHFLNSSRFVQEINLLLKATSNPKKLANLRFLISDLFHTIKDAYKHYKVKEDQFTAVLPLKEQELNRLKASVGNYIIFTHFVEAAVVAPSSLAEIKDLQIVAEITVPFKNSGYEGCNGYISSAKSVLFNLGNYFQITSFDQADKRMKLRLVTFDSIQANLQSKETWLAINQAWGNAQYEQFGGQYYPLLLHDQPAADQYLNTRIAAHKEKQNQAISNCILSRQRWKIRTGQPSYQIQQSIKKLISGEVNRNLANLTLCQLYFTRGNDTRFQEAIKKVGEVKQKESREGIKMQLLRLYERFLSSWEKSGKELLLQLGKQQQSMSKEAGYLSCQTYHLLTSMKIKCLQQVGLFEEELEAINKLALLYSITQGTTSHTVAQINSLKIKVIGLKDQKLTQTENLRKQKLFTSLVNIEEIKKYEKLQQYQLELYKINLELYD